MDYRETAMTHWELSVAKVGRFGERMRSGNSRSTREKAIAERCDENRSMVQAPRSAAMPNRVFLGARGPAAEGKPDESIGGTRLGRRVVELRRTLIVIGFAVRHLFRITDPTQIASAWLLEWHAGVALVVLPGDCAAAPGWCTANP
jgi:hypothetical protein